MSDVRPAPASPPSPPSYGSDQTGMVCGYLFGRAADGTGLALDSEQARAWLQARAQHPAEFIWLHFNLANTASEKWLHEHTALPEEFYESLHEGPRSTRIELADNTLIAVVNDVLHDFTYEPSDISTLWLSVDRQIVISARRKPLRAVDSLRNAVRNGEPIRSSVALLIHLLRDQADALIKIVRGAIRRHVELAVGVARHTRRARRLDIDLRHAIGALHHRRTLPARRIRVGHDLSHGRSGDKAHHAQRPEYGQRQRP